MITYYRVADHVFGIEATEPQLAQLTNYTPFQTDQIGTSCVFIIHVDGNNLQSPEGWTHLYTDRSDDDMPRIEMYQKDEEWLFRISTTREGEVVSTMRCRADWTEVHLTMDEAFVRFAIDNAAMLVYAFRTTGLKTLLFHSSVTMREGRAYMFLGHSGTGKSTHSQQWMNAFKDAELMNDDNPVVRLLEDGTVRVYGSPWSGKTPCYRNISAPVGALVQLAQAPHNEITRLRMSQAYPYILSSVSGLKILPQMMDSLYESIAQLLETVPVYKLECLPNTAAAEVCYEAVKA